MLAHERIVVGVIEAGYFLAGVYGVANLQNGPVQADWRRFFKSKAQGVRSESEMSWPEGQRCLAIAAEIQLSASQVI